MTLNPFTNLMRHQNGENIQDFLNPVHDAIFKFKNINEADQQELQQLLDQVSGDKLFNEFVVKFFVNDLNAFVLKSSIQNVSDFPNITLEDALHVLADVYEKTENELIKGYILFLTFDVNAFIEFALNDWNKVKLDNSLFYQFVESEALTKFLKHNLDVVFASNHGFCLLSFICQNDVSNQAVIPALVKYGNVNINWEQCQDLNSVFAQLVNNYEQLNEPHTTKGFDINGSFENAVKLFTFVAPNWDNLAATFSLRNKPLPAATGFSMAGGSRVSDSDLVKIFAGSYNLVPYTEPKASNTNLDVIADFNAYNQLSSRRKLQVANFLINNRKRFNDVLGEAAQLVINGLQTKLNSTPSFSSYTPTYARSVGFEDNNDGEIQNDAKSFMDKLAKQFKSINIQTFDQAIGFIVHNYIPMLRQFQNRCNETYGLAKAQSVISKYSTDRTLNVIGVAANLPSLSYETTTSDSSAMLSGGARKSTIAPSMNNEESTSTSTQQPTQPTTSSSSSQPSQPPQPVVEPTSENSPIISGSSTASSSANLIAAFVEGQKQFNKDYESIYRKLIAALNGVNINNVHSQTFTKLYSVCNQFDSIAIKNAKTTSYLSGYYGAKNYNRLYTKCVENTIRSIEEAQVPAFNECVNVLKQLKELMTSTARKVQELRSKFINSPKSVSEMLIVAARKIKQPCQLTQKDFNNLTEAVNRIYNTIRNYTSETSTYNTKQQLENYIGKIEDRAKVINEHYDLIIQGLRIKYQQFPINNREREYAKEAQTTILNQIREIMLYLNKTFDAKLAKERIDHLHSVNLTQQQVDAIEKAFLAFRNVRITTEFKEQMEKLNRSLDPLTVGSVFKIVKKLRKVIVKSQYLQFIAQLYKELNIFSEQFNWDEFIDKYTSLVVLSSVRVEPIYKVGSERYTLEGIAHKAASEFENLCCNSTGFKLEDTSNNTIHNAGYAFILDYLRKEITVEAPKGIAEFKTIQSLFGDAHAFDTYIKAESTPKSDQALLKLCATLENTKANFGPGDSDNPGVKFSTKATANGSDGFKMTGDSGSYSIIDALDGIFSTDEAAGVPSNAAKQAILTANVVINSYGKITDKPKPFFFSRLAGYVAVLYKALGGAVSNKFYDFIKNPLERMDYWGVSVVEGSSELPIAEYSIDSLFANIIAIVDKYWAVKYSGNLPIPLNINTILRGGSLTGGSALDEDEIEKQAGGSVFDSMPLHDQTFSSVVPEAVPFYICALHICQYYINTFTIDRIKTEDQNLQLVLSVNKISTLYPVYEIFQKYNATVQSLTPQQLKICLAVFNEYWNQTQGNEAARLSRAIDLIFNELNACFIFTDKLQYDLMKSTNSLSKISVDVINDKLQYLVNTMKDRLSDTMLDLHEDPALQSKRLEGLLSTAFKEIKRNPESQRLSILKALLSKQDDGGELREFYAFMETVVSPLLVCAKAYINIFSLFDNYSFDTDRSKNEYNKQVEEIDFNRVYVRWQDITGDSSVEAKERVDSAWTIIQQITSQRRPELKVLFIENPLVIKYNRLVLNQALAQLHQTGKFVFPRFWIVLDELTYPNSSVISVKLPDTIHRVDTIPLLRQIYPTVNAANVADYYNHCVSEFIADYDHFIHAFLAYPGLSDKTIKLIAKKAHDAFKISNVPIEKDYDSSKSGKFRDDSVYSLRRIGDVDVEADILASAKPLYQIQVNKANYFINPPCPAVGTLIPRFPDVVDVEELEVVNSSKVSTINCVQIDGCGVYIKSKSASEDGINLCEYSWIDWVVYQIARCNNLNFCLPYRFLQLLQDSPALNINLRLPGTTRVKADGIQKYNRNASGVYANILTQNIILRSSSNSNKDKADLSTLSATWAANLVAIIPYVISTLTANKLSMDTSVTYNNQSVHQQINQLIDVLTAFYDEIGNFAPFIAFMSNSVNINAPVVKPHLFAELLSLVSKNDVQTLDINGFVKLEWANQYFFNYIDNIAFPEYKNRDRFEWIKQFAADKIQNGVFRTEFETSVQVLGRLAWASLIAKSNDYVAEFKNTYRELDKTIIQVINIMSEVDTGITNQFIQNVIAEFNDQYVDSGFHRMSGGAITFKSVPIDESNIDFIRRLTRGLFNSVQKVSNSQATQYEEALRARFLSPYTSPPITITPSTKEDSKRVVIDDGTTTPTVVINPAVDVVDKGKTTPDTLKAKNDSSSLANGIADTIEPNNQTPSAIEPKAKIDATVDEAAANLQEKINKAKETGTENPLNAVTKDGKFIDVDNRTSSQDVPKDSFEEIFNKIKQSPVIGLSETEKQSDGRAYQDMANIAKSEVKLFALDIDNEGTIGNAIHDGNKGTDKTLRKSLGTIQTTVKTTKDCSNYLKNLIQAVDRTVVGGKVSKAKQLFSSYKEVAGNVDFLRQRRNDILNVFKELSNDPRFGCEELNKEKVQEIVFKNQQLVKLFNANPGFQTLLNISQGNEAPIDTTYVKNLTFKAVKLEDNNNYHIKFYNALANAVIFANAYPIIALLERMDKIFGKTKTAEKVLTISTLLLMLAGPLSQLIALQKHAIPLAINNTEADEVFFRQAFSICSNGILINDGLDLDIFVGYPLLIVDDCSEYFDFNANNAKDLSLDQNPTDLKTTLIQYCLNYIPYLLIPNMYLDKDSNASKAIITLVLALRQALLAQAKIEGVNESQYIGVLAILQTSVLDALSKSPSIYQTPSNNAFNLTSKEPNIIQTGGKLFISGGAFDKDKIKTIYEIAAGIAQEVKNRAVYYDLSQSFKSCPLLVSPDSNTGSDNVSHVNLNAYYYKFLYNPNLCMLFNKSGFNSREFIIYLLAEQKQFVLNPFSPASGLGVDWGKVDIVLSDSFCTQFGLDKGTTVKSLIGNNTADPAIVNKLVNINNWYHKIITYRKIDVDTSGKVDVSKWKHEGIVLKDIKVPNYTSLNSKQNSTIPKLNDIKERQINAVSFFNNGTLRRPLAHNVKIDDKMFLLSPATQLLVRYLYSPQKDIFNATLYEYSDIGVPTMLNFGELINTKENGENVIFYNFTNQLNHMCRSDFSVSKFAANDTFTEGSAIYADAFKLVSNFCNPQVNPIYNFIQSLLQENINSVFFDDKNLNFNNFGFDLGSVKGNDNIGTLEGAGLVGGFNINDNFTDSLVNVNDTLEGNKELELLNTAYNLDQRNTTQKSVCKSKLLYSYIFRNTLDSSNCNNAVMFHLIVNYFHKYNISFNSMFNQLCFPSILFNAAGLRLSVKRIKSLIDYINIPDVSDVSKEGYKYRLFNFIKFYLNNVADEKGNISFDLAKDYKYQVSFGEAGRIEQLRIEQVEGVVKDVQAKMNASNGTLALGNQYFAPSVANNFVVEFMKYIHINTDKPINHCEKIQSLFGSGIADALRHLDSLITFISVLFMLLKETSYYSHEYERDVSYFNSESPDVFSIV